MNNTLPIGADGIYDFKPEFFPSAEQDARVRAAFSEMPMNVEDYEIGDVLEGIMPGKTTRSMISGIRMQYRDVFQPPVWPEGTLAAAQTQRIIRSRERQAA